MECGFNFELYEMVFENCFIYSSRYKNGNLQLSLSGVDPARFSYSAKMPILNSGVFVSE